jgi:hypothetical protein
MSPVKLILLPRICFHVFRRHRLMMTNLIASLMPVDASLMETVAKIGLAAGPKLEEIAVNPKERNEIS